MPATSPAVAAAARSPEPSFTIGKRELVAMIAMTQALQALCIDSILPALPDLARDLAITDPNSRQLIIGIYLIGAAVGALVPGTLSDRFGRRRVLIGATLLYAAICLACALATDLGMLLVLRFACGVLTGGLPAVGSAIVRDRFDGDTMASIQSLVFMVFAVVPMVAPSLGQAVLLFAGWRWIFGMTAVLGLVMSAWLALRLPESLPPERRQPVSFAKVFGNAGEVLRCRESIGYVLATALSIGIMLGYIQSSQQLLGEHFGAGRAFPLIFGGMAVFLILANFVNSRIVLHFGARRTGHAALIVYALTACVQCWMAWRGNQTLWEFVPLMVISMACGGFYGANFAAIAIQPFVHIAGAASSLQLFVRMLGASLIGAMIGQSYDNTARPLTTAMLFASLLALALVLWSEHGRLFRRLNPPRAEPG